MIPYKHECETREDIKAARAQMFSVLRGHYPETNREGLTLGEWYAAANFGVSPENHIAGPIVALAWIRGEDPTEWAAAGDQTRPGQTIDGRYVVAVKGGEPLVVLRNWSRAVVDYEMTLPRIKRKYSQPRPKGPVKVFFETITRLHKEVGGRWKDRFNADGIKISSKRQHECNPEDCHKLDNGLWESKPDNLGFNRSLQVHQFIWRLHPNYCVYGQPIFGREKIEEFRDKSETEKVLLVHDGYEFIWGWDEIQMPDHIRWGMTMGKTYFTVRKDGETIVAPTTVKKHFIEDWETHVQKSN